MCLCALALPLAAAGQTVNVLYTTDVHGAIFNHDFVRDTVSEYSLANAYTYIQSVRDTSRNVLLLDAGDFLQGTPAVYFYNNIDTGAVNVMARIFNYMKYDAVTVGNHDIETQHHVFDKVRRELQMPMLGANVLDAKTGEPYFTPYVVLHSAGKKIAVLGMTSPYIPHWLPESYWHGLKFDDMVETAKKWVEIIRRDEKPDALIGLFHSGYDFTYGNQKADDRCNENASVLVAERVDGFDAILIGHDHKLYNNKKITSPSGRTVPVLDAGTAARNLGLLQLTFDKQGRLTCRTDLVALKSSKPSKAYDEKFASQQFAVKSYTRKEIGTMDHTLDARQSLAGSTEFTDLVHATMLRHTGADISMTAPLLLDAKIEQGPLSVGRMFSIYKYENNLCVVRLTGAEVVKYLEYSYSLWIDNPDKTAHILNMDNRGRLKYKYYNMDSAAGIRYTVDVTKPEGQRVKVLSMADGKPFDLKREYKVAVSSYRANGGGGHLEHCTGLPFERLAERLVSTSQSDLRGLIIADFEKMAAQNNGQIKVEKLNLWHFLPQKLVDKYMQDDIKLAR